MKAQRKPARALPDTGRLLDFGIAALLAVGVFVAYAQTAHFGFVNFDDPDYGTGNPHVSAGLTPAGIAWAFTHSFAGNWFPLTWLSHMLDFDLFGTDAGYQHLTSVALHAVSAMLLFGVLRRITARRWPSAMVASLFALHPLHVESVAWIAERKDVLCAFFWMLTLWVYARYVERSNTPRYVLTLAAFCCGLMAKPMMVTLPFVLCLLDYWPFARGVRWREKLPFLALAAAASVIAFVVHREAGATATLDVFPLALRIENALWSYAVYALKMFWPSNLAVYYPYPRESMAARALLAAIALVAVTILAIRTAKRRPYLIVGWGWYLVTLAPVIGLIQVGGQARADRYTYIPMIGLSIAVVWSLAEGLQPWPRLRAAAGWSACVLCAALTWSQVRYWQDGVTLFRRAIEVTSDNYFARFNLAAALDERGETADAARQLAEAVRVQPRFAAARAELGQLLAKQGQFPEAIVQLHEAEQLSPADAIIHYRLGTVLGKAGRDSAASAEFRESARLDPQNSDVHYNLGISLAGQGKLAEAAAEFATAVKLKPDDAYSRLNWGIALAKLGRTQESIAQLSEALRIEPRLPGAREILEQVTASQDAGRK